MAPMRVALVGLGKAAETIHWPACAAVGALRVVAACDPDPERRARFRNLGVERVEADAAAVLEPGQVDLVVIGAPPAVHFDLASSAIAAGAHVLCEKPFVGSIEEADRLVDAADRRGVLLRVNTQYRHMPIYRAARGEVDGGRLGSPRLLQVWQQMYYPPERATGWRGASDRSTLWEFGPHAVDLATYLLGGLPDRVHALIPDCRPDSTADVIAVVTLGFGRERVAQLTFNRISHAPERYLEMRLDGSEASLRISFGGVARASLDWVRQRSGPRARVDVVRGGLLRREREGRSRVLARQGKGSRAAATARLLEEMVRHAQAGQVDNRPAVHARDVTGIILAAYESAETGASVALAGRLRSGAGR